MIRARRDGNTSRHLERLDEAFACRVCVELESVAGAVLENLGEAAAADAELQAGLAGFRELGERWGLGNILVARAERSGTRGSFLGNRHERSDPEITPGSHQSRDHSKHHADNRHTEHG